MSAISIVIAAALMLVVGCGGGVMSANDMKKYAIRRAPDVEVKPPSAATQSSTAPSVSTDASEESDESMKPSANASSLASAPQSSSAPQNLSNQQPTEDSNRAETIPSHAVSPALSDRQTPPATPLDAETRGRQTVENLRRIGTALEAYHKDKGVYPTRALCDNKGRPLLSWRVELLPYLGYEKLYALFGTNEPWNSRRNSELVALIPAVYQSPERFDERTNYLVPVASSTIFGKVRGIPASSIDDGAANTVLVLEADDVAAAPWTEPREFELDLNTPTKNVGDLRGGAMYVVWGGGEVGRVLTSAPRDALRAMFTYDAGENFLAGQIDQPLFAGYEGKAASQSRSPASDHQTGGGESDEVGTASNRDDSNLASLAQTFFHRSAEALSDGREREARNWFYAGAVISPSGSPWAEQYQWIPALRRPLPILRFGVGLNYRGPREKELREGVVADMGQRASARVPTSWSIVTGELGKQIVSELSSHWKKCGNDSVNNISTLNPKTRRGTPSRHSLFDSAHGLPIAPGVYFLTVARSAVLLEMARREAIDVLVVVDWRDMGHKWSAGITFLDVARGDQLLKLPRIDSTELEKSRSDALAANPLAEALRQFKAFLGDQLTPQALPKQIQPRHVIRRLETLAADDNKENPIQSLAEMRYYHERGLADETQLLLAYQELIGTKPGSILILGNAKAKERLIKEWLAMQVNELEDASIHHDYD